MYPGESNALKEDAALAAVAESSGHSVVELDFLGQDTWELVGAASQSDVDLLPPDTQLSLRRALVRRRKKKGTKEEGE